MRLSLILIAILLAASASAETAIDDTARQAAKAITQPALEAPVRFLASDPLEGRAPGSRGDRLARLYLETELESLGLQPGAPNGKWQQTFKLVGVTTDPPAAWPFRKGSQSLELRDSEEFIVYSGKQKEASRLEDAELVFVGYGIQAPEYRWDDYKGADLRGKVLVMMNNDPDWDPKLFEGIRRLYYGRWGYKYQMAAQQGAAGAIIIHTVPSAGYRWQVVQTSWSGPQFELPAGSEARLEVQAWATEEAARKLATLAGHDLDRLIASAKSRDFKPVPLGVTTSISLTNKLATVETGNVLGLLPGSDPILKNEVVIYTAHHDHLGVGKPNKAGDTIYNGALDNASGCAQVLAIAKAFRELGRSPRRSVLFLFVAAEEQGLLGSLYYSMNPTFPPGRIAANVNFDGANIWGRTSDVVQVGYGKSSLDHLVQSLAKSLGRTLKPEQFPDRGSYYRSDQFSFAKIGVPAIYLDGGVDFPGKPEGWGKQQIEGWEAEHYHQASDELTGTWDFTGIIDDAQLGFYAGYALAQQDAMPAWNPGDEFESRRRDAIAALKGTKATITVTTPGAPSADRPSDQKE